LAIFFVRAASSRLDAVAVEGKEGLAKNSRPRCGRENNVAMECIDGSWEAIDATAQNPAPCRLASAFKSSMPLRALFLVAVPGAGVVTTVRTAVTVPDHYKHR
jgi:hypothetical protein